MIKLHPRGVPKDFQLHQCHFLTVGLIPNTWRMWVWLCLTLEIPNNSCMYDSREIQKVTKLLWFSPAETENNRLNFHFQFTALTMKQEDKEVISGKSHFNKIRLEQLIAVSFPILPLNKLQPAGEWRPSSVFNHLPLLIFFTRKLRAEPQIHFSPACSTYSNSLNFPNTDKHSCCEEMKPH